MSKLPIQLAVLLLITFIPSFTAALTNIFNFSSFNRTNIKLHGDASMDVRTSVIELTNNDITGNTRNRTGWAIFPEPVTLYDIGTRFAADFQSNFSIQINPINGTCRGDGLAFFIARADWSHNPAYNGGGLVNRTEGRSNAQTVVIEFDTYQNDFDPSKHHMGIGINSYKPNVTKDWALNTSMPLIGTAFIDYNFARRRLSTLLAFQNGTLDVSLDNINLTTVLPEKVLVGFSASTGACSGEHRIFNWSFSATVPNMTAPNRTSDAGTNHREAPAATRNNMGIILVSCWVPLVIIVAVIIMVVVRRRKKKKEKLMLEEIEGEEEEETDGSMDVAMNFEATGPRKFRYAELASATNDFCKEGKLGQGGFGGVYRGILRDTNEVVAVKRFSKGSSQGKKEYVAEVTAISRLRHRNLVRLIGWCHEQREFLLVYEYMEGGSLDSHLFSKKDCPILPWARRRKAVLDLASAVLYLHEEWEQCVVHRDIKLSNVMVDSEFHARLGDFGLARLTNHGFAPRTTLLAGTVGYLAPECVITGKASTQTDVYSFGVVLLEIATGRRAVQPIGEKEARLIDWIWELYGLGSLIVAVDERLGSEFDQQEMERMMVVGLWCVHPDPERRPTMREAIRVLNFQAEIPSLPQKMPVPVYLQPPKDVCGPMFMSSSSGTIATSTTASSTWSMDLTLPR